MYFPDHRPRRSYIEDRVKREESCVLDACQLFSVMINRCLGSEIALAARMVETAIFRERPYEWFEPTLIRASLLYEADEALSSVQWL
jgi:hypothetical protein